MKKTLIFLVVYLLIWQSLPLMAQSEVENGVSPEAMLKLGQQHKDPFLAGVLSGLFWGLGNFYTRDYTSGSLFMFGDLVFKGLVVGLAIKLKNKYTSGDDREIRWREIDSTDKGLVISTAAIWIGMTIFSIADAASSAKKFNFYRGQPAGFDFDISQREGSPFVSLGFKTPF